MRDSAHLKNTRIFGMCPSIGFLIAAVALGSLPFLGETVIPLSDIFREGANSTVFWQLRLPRFIWVILLGGSLSVLGACYQALLSNELAEPYVLGVSSAVTCCVAGGELFLGIAVGTLASWTCGAAGASIASLILGWIFWSDPQGSQSRVLLSGIGLNFFFSSLLFLLISLVTQSTGAGSLRWLLGSIPWVDWSDLACVAPLIVGGLFILVAASRWLDALSLGDRVASTMGVSPKRARALFLVVTSILVGVLASISGSIGFVGLVVPQSVRLVFHPATQRGLMVRSFFCGGGFLAVCDVLSRVLVPPLEMPIGVLTTLLGGPAFLFLLLRRIPA